MRASLSILLLGLVFTSRLGLAQTEVITVTGVRIKEESERSSRTGQSKTIQPQESSRFDTATQLKRESALTFVETGRISPSGFIIPKIRGQDAKLTDVYLEDTLLQDPYSGLPLVDDLDLRAFGLLELHQGVSPVGVPNINAIGTLRYRFKNVNRSQASAGLSTGSPYGVSLWGLGIHKSEEPGTDRELRLYARTHQTSGRYRYYSDEGTPYNSKDDEKKFRENNDQRSQQIIPIYRETFGAYSLQALAWFYEAERGIASNSMVLDSLAREANKGFLGDVSLSHRWSDTLVFDSVELGGHVAKTEDKRETEDPDRRVLNSSTQASMNIRSDRQGIHLKTDSKSVRSSLSFEQSQSTIEQSFEGKTGTSLKRKNGMGLVGLALAPWDAVLLELKHSEQRQSDKTDERIKVVLDDEENKPNSHKKSAADTLSLAFGDYEDGIYGQMARTERLPSLFEEFGNGSTVRPNQDLKAETINHRELGGFTHVLGVDWGAAHYRDKTDDKIVFIPILANASKALNVAETEIQGTDGSVGWVGESTRLSFKISALEAYDTSRREKKLLPGIPERIMIGEWREQWTRAAVSYLTARYRSDVYRDLANSIKLPGSFIYDVNVDYKYRRVEIGLALQNLMNTMDVEISSGLSKGRTGFSDLAGAPLPGRQWILSLVYTTED